VTVSARPVLLGAFEGIGVDVKIDVRLLFLTQQIPRRM
jgi:hypothetical protein